MNQENAAGELPEFNRNPARSSPFPRPRVDRRIAESPMNDKQSSQQAHSVEPVPQLLRLPAVMRATGLARSTVYRMIAEHTFPGPVKLGKRAVGWHVEDVRQWTLGRPSAVAVTRLACAD